MTAELILYACPRGELADQLEHYFDDARQQFSWNPAHDYMPHCSLTGFFHDSPDSIPRYVAAITNALAVKRPTIPFPALAVSDLLFRPDFHGLTLSSEWMPGFTASFAASAPADTRTDRLRLKHWLHLSLAYRFPASEHEPLRDLARRTVTAEAPVHWDLNFYQRHPDKSWTCHGQWSLDCFREPARCL